MKNIDLISGTALFSIGACSLILHEGYGLSLSILFIIGTFILLKKNKIDILPTKDVMVFFLPFLIFSIYFSLNSAIIDRPNSDSFKFIRILAIAIVCIPIFSLKPSPIYFFTGFAFGSILTLIFASHAFYQGVSRPGLYMHPIQLGNIALLSGFISALGLLYLKSNHNYFLKTFLFIGFLCGILTSILSGTRGGWPLIPPFIFFVGYHFFTRTTASKKILMTIFCAFTTICFLTFSQNTQLRVVTAAEEVILYYNGDPKLTSVGQRFELWKNTLILVEDHPVFGIGQIQFQEQRDNLIKTKELNIAHPFSHMHNDILDALVKRGIIGGILTLLITLIPFILFQSIIQKANYNSLIIARTGQWVAASFFVFGLTEAMLFSKSGILIYPFWMAILYALAVNERKNLKCQH